MHTFNCFQQVMSPVAPWLCYTVEITNCENLSIQFILVEKRGSLSQVVDLISLSLSIFSPPCFNCSIYCRGVLKFNIYCSKKRHCACALLTAFNTYDNITNLKIHSKRKTINTNNYAVNLSSAFLFSSL